MKFAGKNTRVAGQCTRHTQTKKFQTQAKVHAQAQAKMLAIAPKNTWKRKHNYMQLHSKLTEIAGKKTHNTSNLQSYRG